MECPICYEEYGHAPYCPIAIENEVAYDEFKEERKKALKQAKKRAKAESNTCTNPEGHRYIIGGMCEFCAQPDPNRQ